MNVRSVPVAVPSINFLSGGQSLEEANANLNVINQQAVNEPRQLNGFYEPNHNKLLSDLA